MSSNIKNKRLLHGVGKNDSITQVWTTQSGVRVICPFYRAWKSMLERCYSRKFQERKQCYLGCSVDPAWLTFSSFRDWMKSKPWDGNQLDKDLLVYGNKVYGPNTCVFISSALNNFLTDYVTKGRTVPSGVAWHNIALKYMARIRNPFTRKTEHLGLFLDPREAHEAWRKRKHDFAMIYADQQDDKKIAEALRSRYFHVRPIEAHGQLVDAYVLEWLGNDGIVKGVSR